MAHVHAYSDGLSGHFFFTSPGEDPDAIAKRLTMKIYWMVRGGMAGFNRRLSSK